MIKENSILKKNIQKDNIGTFLLFLIWPFLSVIVSFKQYKFYSSRNAIWFYNIFLGATYYFAEGTDSNRYNERLAELYNKVDFGFYDFLQLLFWGEEGARIDFVEPLINFLVSRFTDNGHALFAAYGFVFGYFYSRNIWFLIDLIKGKIKAEAFAYFLLFCFLVPFWQITGFRYWTATQIFFYGVIQVFFNGKTFRGNFFIILSFFVHDSYIIGIGLFYIYKLMGNRIHFLFIFYFISFFANLISAEFIKNVIELLPFQLNDRSGYLNEEYIEFVKGKSENINWYLDYKYPMIKTLCAGSFTWIYFRRLEILKSNKYLMDLFCLGLVFITFGNLVDHIPSMGRFYYIGYLSVSMMLFLFFQNTPFKRRPDWYKALTLTVVGLFCFVELWAGLMFFSLSSIISNVFTLFLFEQDTSLFKVIKSIF